MANLNTNKIKRGSKNTDRTSRANTRHLKRILIFLKENEGKKFHKTKIRDVGLGNHNKDVINDALLFLLGIGLIKKEWSPSLSTNVYSINENNN